MGEAIECEALTHEKYDVDGEFLKKSLNWWKILAYGIVLNLAIWIVTELAPSSKMVI